MRKIHKVVLFLLIANLACKLVDYAILVGPDFIHKCCYAQAWVIVWNYGLLGLSHDALAIAGLFLVTKISDNSVARNF